jgi:hypothetical protein
MPSFGRRPNDDQDAGKYQRFPEKRSAEVVWAGVANWLLWVLTCAAAKWALVGSQRRTSSARSSEPALTLDIAPVQVPRRPALAGRRRG